MKTLKRYLITLAIGFAIVLVFSFSMDLFSQTHPKVIFMILTNAFFIAGILITAAGLLVFSSNEGTFDMIVYGVDSFMDMFRRESRKKYNTFYDYREAHAQKKLKFGYLVVCGLGFIAVSLVMYLLYTKY